MAQVIPITNTTEPMAQAKDLNEKALRAKRSREEMEGLLKECQAFLRSRVSRYGSRYDEDQREELMNTAMLAMVEAVQKYDSGRGHFFPFADRVICGRIIDENRKLMRRQISVIPLEDEDEDRSSAQSAVITEISTANYRQRLDNEALADEIEQFKVELAEWGITLETLVKQSPKHDRLREECKKTIARICDSPDILQVIQVKRYFPLSAIANISGLPIKKLERVRSFILASLIIKTGNYDFLSEYVSDRW